MAKIPDGTFKQWNDTEVIHAAEYVQEREMLRVAANDNSDRLSSLETVTTALQLDTVQLQKITSDSGDVKLATSSTNDDILQKILSEGQGMHTFYAVGGSKNLPSTNISIRGIAHFTSASIGWVYATDYRNNIFTNYYDTTKWSGWKRLAREEELPTETEWAKLTLGTGLTTYAPGTDLRWKRVGNVVYVTGAFNGDLDWDEVVATLPTGARPTYTHHFIMPTSMGSGKEGRDARYVIGTDGKISFVTTSDGIINTSAWYPINTSFVI